MGYKNDYKKIKEYAKQLKSKYNFKGLLHFTDFSNLCTILKCGYLYSRGQCEKSGIEFIDGANHSVLDKAGDYVHNCVRFYYRGATPTLYDNEGIKLKEYSNEIHVPIPVYLLFSRKLLYLESTVFTNGNATNSDMGNDYDFFSSMDWDAIFHDTYFEPSQRDYIINKRQAELLSEEPVSLKYLKKIIFRCEADRKRAINIFGQDDRYEVNIDLFSSKNKRGDRYRPKNDWQKNNFIKDYSIEYGYDSNNNRCSIKLSLDFQKNWNEYEKSIAIKDIHGKYIEIPPFTINYKNFLGKEFSESKFNSESIIFRVNGNIEEWSKIEVYVNNILCIEEFPLKDIIKEYKIYNDDKGYLIIYREFRNLNFKNYKHRVEIFNSDNEMICTTNTSFKTESKGLKWWLTLKNYDESWNKVNYYINDILCISQYIRRD